MIKLIDLLFGNFRRPKREALIKAKKCISKKGREEACQKELYSFLTDKNGSLGIPVK